ncbi:uncharacterized protein LOC107303887 isoform X1 [Oryza brachyantha]|uniref:uncharacterized protein LOC107303887 isoform X1 n=1 Tax=Oryza brachyantha TaxID=4533 RepID=UPI000776329E|nr:uncharacterized protein LOC107303887 isoform X1 [Oryza brachyantha]
MKRLPLFVLLVVTFAGGGNMSAGMSLDARSMAKSSADHQAYGGIELNGRRLQERRLDSTNRKTRSLEDVRIDDYRPVDPSPSSKATIGAGPIEHGTPLLPYVPRPTPPPDHPAQSPVT